MTDLPPLGWFALCAVVVIIIVLNLSLVAFLRYRPTMKIRPPRRDGDWKKMSNMNLD